MLMPLAKQCRQGKAMPPLRFAYPSEEARPYGWGHRQQGEGGNINIIRL